jgi:hypothetical protein
MDHDAREISGKRVYLTTPSGTEMPLTYHANGALDGEVSGGLKLVQKSDYGNWWISGDRMCQKWRNWYHGRVYCFNLHLRALFAPIESDRGFSSLFLPHFLRRTGGHFAGKCSSGANRFEWHRNDGPTGRGRIDD